MLQRVRKTLAKSVRTRGMWGTFTWTFRAAAGAARELAPSNRHRRLHADMAAKAFDLKHGIDTAGVIPLASLKIDNPAWESGIRYEGIDPETFREMMSAAGDVAPGRTFVDFGCGKGRALLLASEYPFERIVGVEFSDELVEVARRNLVSQQNFQTRCSSVEVVAGDAAAFPIPPGPLVLFFYNPFDATVMGRVVENVARSLERQPRPVTVIYNTPDHDDLWAGVPGLTRSVAKRGYSIYQGVEFESP